MNKVSNDLFDIIGRIKLGYFVVYFTALLCIEDEMIVLVPHSSQFLHLCCYLGWEKFPDDVEVEQLADPVRFVLLVDVVVALVQVAPPSSPVKGLRQAGVSVHGPRHEVLVVNLRVLY